MTITNVFGEVISRPEFDLEGRTPIDSLSQIPGGSRITIDAHILVFKGLVRLECARQFNMDRIHPVTQITKYLSDWIKLYESHNLKQLWVFDGISPPAKSATDQRRKAIRKKYQDQLEAYYRQGHAQKYGEVEALWKKVVCPRGDIIFIVKRLLQGRRIPFMQSPFEAEAQCVRLQMDGIVDYVHSDDGDCFAYGVKKWITMLALTSGRCCVMDSDDILKRPSAGRGRVPIFRGCDYCPNVSPPIPSNNGGACCQRGQGQVPI